MVAVQIRRLTRALFTVVGATLLLGCETNGARPGPPPPDTVESQAPAPKAAPPAKRQQTLTTHAQMGRHMALTEALQAALIRGDEAQIKAQALALSKEQWSINAKPDWRAHIDAMDAAATRVAETVGVAAASLEFAKLASACAGCHQSLSGEQKHFQAPERPSDDAHPMAKHQLAADQMWFGLIAPSEESWRAGATLLAKAPLVRSDMVELDQLERRVHELAKQAESARAAARPKIYGEFLGTCSGCHTKLGVKIDGH